MTLAQTLRIEEIVLLRYLLGPGSPDHHYLRWAIEPSRLCPPSATAFSVGAVIVAAGGEVLATGFSREKEKPRPRRRTNPAETGPRTPAPARHLPSAHRVQCT
jgi:hypothetical protein